MTPASNETSGLRHYLATLRRGAFLILVVTLAVTGAAVLQTLRQEKLYRSSINVFLDPRAVNSSISAVQGSGDPERILDTQAAAAQIPEIADRAVRLAGVPERDGNAFLAQTTVAPAPNADILTFAVTDPNPALARKLTIAYATSYQEYRRESETIALRRARKSLAGDIKRARQAVERGTANTSGLERLLETDRQLEGREQEVKLGTTVALGRLPSGAAQTQPHPRRNAILGAILGLMLGIGIVFLRDTLNTRVRTAADVEERLGMPLLGRLEQPPKSLRTRNRLLMLETPTAPSAEAFRLLATNLEFTNLDRGARSIMITSANRAEGKSTTVANLAVALARSGRRVILIDLDLRRPIISRFFDLDEPTGVTEVALGRATLDDALVRIPLEAYADVGGTPETTTNGNSASHHHSSSSAEDERRALSAVVAARRGQQAQGQGTLDVLAAGPLPPSPAEFLRSQAMSHVLAEAGERADIVLVDAPPILQVSDAAILTPKVDAVMVATLMLVVRRATLDELRRVLEKAPVTKIGFVVTGANAEEGFAGRDGYGYGLGYGPDETKKRRSILSRR